MEMRQGRWGGGGGEKEGEGASADGGDAEFHLNPRG